MNSSGGGTVSDRWRAPSDNAINVVNGKQVSKI